MSTIQGIPLGSDELELSQHTAMRILRSIVYGDNDVYQPVPSSPTPVPLTESEDPVSSDEADRYWEVDLGGVELVIDVIDLRDETDEAEETLEESSQTIP
jgi:hypothetical protein